MGLMQKPFADLVTFTRASTAGYWNWQGIYTIGAANEQRIDHDPATLSLSTSSVTLGAGQHTFATTRLYTVGDVLRASADANNWMIGRVSAATGASVTIEVLGAVTGSGTFSSWTLIVRLGILAEEQRTNLLTYSSDFDNSVWAKNASAAVTENFALSPDATVVADLLTMSNSAASGVYRLNLASATIGANFVFSVFAKLQSGAGKFRLNLEGAAYSGAAKSITADLVAGTVAVVSGASGGVINCGNGWYRFWVTGAAVAAGAVNITIYNQVSSPTAQQIILWGAQLATGSFPTSYIPTTTAQVTRAADVASVNVLSPWYRADEGTLFVEYSRQWESSPFQGRVAYLSGPDTSKAIQIRAGGNGSALGTISNSGAISADIQSAPLPAAGAKAALSWNAAGASLAADGASVGEDGAVVLPQGLTTLWLGNSFGSTQLRGHIESIRYFPRRLSDSELQALTA